MGLVMFGLTGGLATGKSTVAARFRERRLPVVDADEIAREVVAPGTAALDELCRAFGPDILLPDGSLDRKKMAARVFSDGEARARLEAITHPRIAEASQRARRELELHDEPLACYEATLLVERGLADSFRPLVVVAATAADQVARARARGGLSDEEARARLAAQLPTKDKEAVADHVIKNDRDRAYLVEEADAVLDAVCASLGIDASRYPRQSST